MTKNIKYLLLLSLTIVACTKDEVDVVAVTPEVPIIAGTANFSKFVSLGNSLTAGFSDNALFKKGQEGSYANLMAEQFKLAGGGMFKIPFMNDNRGGLLFGGAPNPAFAPRITITGVVNNNPNIGLAYPFGTQTTETANNIFVAQGPFNNMGVPGAKSFHLLAPGYGSFSGLLSTPPTANPYFVRFSSSSTASVLSDAMAQAPTFFSLWIGNNDVLGYALAGGVTTSQDPIKGGDITPSAGAPGVGFDASYTFLVNTLISGGAKGVVANIPYVTTIPQFTTVPTNPIPLDAATATQLNTGLLGPVDAILTALGQPDRLVILKAGTSNPLLIIDETLTNFSAQISGALQANGVSVPQATLMGNLYGQARHARNDISAPNNRDYVLLTTRGIISPPNNLQTGVPAPFNTRGVTYPLQDAAVLTADEALQIKIATDAYNVTIKSLADSKGLAFVDANALLSRVASGGIRFGQYHLSASYVVGGAFSYDGVHPAPQGYALIANEFLKAINLKYGSTFRGYDITNFPIQHPAVLPN